MVTQARWRAQQARCRLRAGVLQCASEISVGQALARRVGAPAGPSRGWSDELRGHRCVDACGLSGGRPVCRCHVVCRGGRSVGKMVGI